MSRYLYTCLLALFLADLQAQSILRKEFERDEGGTGSLVTLGNHGFIMHGMSTEDGHEREYSITWFDTELEETSQHFLEVPRSVSASETYVSSDKKRAWFFFADQKGNFQLYETSVHSPQPEIRTGVLPRKFSIDEIFVASGHLFLKGKLKRRPMILHVDTHTGLQKILTLHADPRTIWIDEVQLLEKDEKVVITFREGKGDDRVMKLAFYDLDGNRLGEPLDMSSDDRLVTRCRVTWITPDHFLVSGTCSTDGDNKPNGIYLMEYRNNNRTFDTYSSFTEMSNYMDFVHVGNKDRAEKKIQRKKNAGQQDFIQSFVHTHQVLQFKGQYILVAEAFYPTYRTETYTNYVNGRAVMSSRQVFDGYQYTHATILGYDQQGKQLWDHSFAMYPLQKPYRIIEMAQVAQTEDNIRMICMDRSVIRAFYLDTEKVDEKELGRIAPENSEDELRSTGFSSSEYWYDQYFISYAYQTIRNPEEERGKRKRRVFVVSRIAFEE